MKNYLEIKNLDYSINNENILNDVNLSINKKGDIICLLGPSGIGKTTILRSIAGLIKPTNGEINLNHKILTNSKKFIDPENRNISLSFQDNSLFPHYTVKENIMFGIKTSLFCSKNKNGPLIYSMNDLLDLFFITEHKDKYPYELSAGQAQRVSLVRSIIQNPDLLLLDEPLANIDQYLKNKIQDNLKKILKKTGLTTIIVTHDKFEAFYLGDYCGVMLNKRIVQFDSPYNLHHLPKNKLVVEFFDRGVLIPAKVKSQDTLFNKDLGEIKGNFSNIDFNGRDKVDLLIQPEDLIHDDKSSLKFEIVDKKFRGSSFTYILKTPSNLMLPVFVHSHHEHFHQENEKFGIKQPIYIDHLVCF